MATTQRTVELTTADGHALAADLALPDDPVASLIVCHPHPLYGGNRFNPVVEAIFTRAAAAGLAAVRFDFRREHGSGIAERADVVAAIDEMARHGGGPTFVAGYSLGAAVALTTVDERIAGLVAVAPPLAMFEVEPPTVPTLVIAPRHDQITDVAAVTETVTSWPNAELEVLPSADHFLAGHTAQVGDLTVAALAAWLSDRS
ncbi:MAG: alpha/beta fold hydrolase [Ilumatobacter fluminis]|uniref:alpha/beta hydrolase n=1 Tax=Ilumatobacter fluminis TaxID=467091 RepID=UPI0032F078F9